MIRKAMNMLLVAVVAVCFLGSMAEAAPKKTVRHRAKHSTRVSSGTEPSTPAKASRKATTKRRAAHHSTAARHKTTTKPR
jgi:hypothetical protein